ncbi:hypothetical protein B0H12DRAFT_398397 [Mycena haematopus]|nr:hypothetical protein B0H12DRAFT_398397 [Mycena haematopus]
MQQILPDSVEADLHLATTFFACSTDGEPLRSSTILVHPSTTRFRYGEWDYESDSLQGTLSEEAWNAANSVQFQKQAHRSARLVVEACGLDPDVTTSTEMDEINPALECLNCGNEHGRLVMRWIQAVRSPSLLRFDFTDDSLQTYHICGSSEPPSWKCLNVDEERLLEAEENQDLESSRASYAFQYLQCCKICGDRRKMSIPALKDHLLTEHNISDLTTENIAYPLDVGPVNRLPQPIRLKPPVNEVETKENGNTSPVVAAGEV